LEQAGDGVVPEKTSVVGKLSEDMRSVLCVGSLISFATGGRDPITPKDPSARPHPTRLAVGGAFSQRPLLASIGSDFSATCLAKSAPHCWQCKPASDRNCFRVRVISFPHLGQVIVTLCLSS
jgi:hypothetical protein